jgi:hypothetical protein
MTFHRDNHYVPRLYLKHFLDSHGCIPTYRILVAHQRQHEWTFSSTKGVAWHAHLYTRIVSGGESDEVELWFKREFEDPAEDRAGILALCRSTRSHQYPEGAARAKMDDPFSPKWPGLVHLRRPGC